MAECLNPHMDPDGESFHRRNASSSASRKRYHNLWRVASPQTSTLSVIEVDPKIPSLLDDMILATETLPNFSWTGKGED